MLENIRKYSALMVIVVVLLAFGLIVTLRNDGGATASKEDIVVVNGHGLTQKEISTELIDPMRLFQVLQKYAPTASVNANEVFRAYQQVYFGIGYPKAETELSPAITLLLNQDEAKKLGIFVTQEDAATFILEELFVDAEGQTDQTRYAEFEKDGLKNLNLNPGSFKKFISNILTISKLQQIKSIDAVAFSAEKHIADINNQTINADLIQFQVADILEVEEPTEEEINAFYEANKNSSKYGSSHFRTEPKVKISYIPVNLNPLPSLTPDKQNQGIVDSGIALQKLTYDNYRKLTNDEDLYGADPDLEALAKKHDLQFFTTELVETKDLSKGVDGIKDFQLIGEFANRGYVSFYDYIASKNIKKCKKLEVNVKGSYKDRSFLHYKLVDRVDSRLKTLEEAKADVIKLIKTERKEKATVEAAEAAKKLVETALTEGNDLKASLKGTKAKIIAFTKLTPITAANADAQFDNRELFKTVKHADNKSVSDVLKNANAAGFLVVNSRTIEKDAKIAEDDAAKAAYFPAIAGYYEWLLQAYATADENGDIKLPVAQ